MRFLIPTIGTRGDIQPYIALALGLQNAGHAVTLATHPCMRGLVEGYGVHFAPIGPDIDIGHEAAVIRGHSSNWVMGFFRVMNFSFAMLEKAHIELIDLCNSADMVIVSHTAAGSIEVEQLHLPYISVTLMPQAIRVEDPTEPFIKRAAMKVAGAGMGLIMTRPLNQIRKRLGVPSMGPTGITSPRLNLIPLSPAIIPPDPRWEPRHRMTGYWFAPSPQHWSPDDALLAFLEAGVPPVVISLGAMALSGADALEGARITLDAAAQAGVRVIIQGWEAAMKQLTIPPFAFQAGSIPHDWLLARASGLVHHGGFGTTAAGFRAGVPTLVIPHIIDQFLWGQKVAELGVGPQPIARSKLTASGMASALREMQSIDMRARAAALANRLCQEPDGVQVAVSLIEANL